VTTAHGGTGDEVVDMDHVRHYQVYRGMSPNSSNRLEVDIRQDNCYHDECVTVCVRERGRESERQTDRQTECVAV